MHKPNRAKLFGERCTQRAKDLKLTQTAIGKMRNRPQSQVSRDFSGEVLPDIDTVEEYAKILHADPWWLLGYDDRAELTPIEPKQEEVTARAMELLQDPERLAVISIIFSLDKERLGTVRDVISRYAVSRPNKDKSTATG
jgi:transcriptional regulator with XRE-family HTH domain